MRLMVLASVDNVHTVKWLRHAVLRGYEVHAASFADHQKEPPVAGVTYHVIEGHPNRGYLLSGASVRRIVRKVQPDILHAHYVSGYGTLGSAAAFHPYVLSAWGSDVYEFPDRSPLHRMLAARNLMAADRVCSTSLAMARRIQALAPRLKSVTLTPFGVDTHSFSPEPEEQPRQVLTIGTVKGLWRTYGIDILIRAFAILVHQHPTEQLRLVIAGDGPDFAELRALSESLEVGSLTTFVGRVPHSDVPRVLRQLDVFVAASRQESFGVAVLEAESCALPVVVSDAGGLPEVVLDGQTGFVVPVEDAQSLAGRLAVLIGDPELRRRMGCRAREYVRVTWDWSTTSKAMDQVYDEIMRRNRT